MDKETYTSTSGGAIAYEIAFRTAVQFAGVRDPILPIFSVGTNVMARKYFRLAL